MSPFVRLGRATFLLAFLFALPAWAESFFVRPATSSSLPADQLSSVTELVQIAVSGTSGAQLVDSEKQAGAVLQPKVLKLGSNYVLSVTKIKGGQQVFTQQARAKGFEDMDTVSQRVVRAVINEVKFENDTRVSDVTEDQVTRGTRRLEATRQWFMSIGPAGVQNLNTDNMAVMWQFGRSWGLDANWAINLAWEFINPKDSNASFNNFYIGADYFFNDRAMSPYLSGGFGYGSASAQEQSNNIFGVSNDTARGFTGSLGGGLKFFRAHSVNLGIGARYSRVFDTTTHGQPSAWSAALTVYF